MLNLWVLWIWSSQPPKDPYYLLKTQARISCYGCRERKQKTSSSSHLPRGVTEKAHLSQETETHPQDCVPHRGPVFQIRTLSKDRRCTLLAAALRTPHLTTSEESLRSQQTLTQRWGRDSNSDENQYNYSIVISTILRNNCKLGFSERKSCLYPSTPDRHPPAVLPFTFSKTSLAFFFRLWFLLLFPCKLVTWTPIPITPVSSSACMSSPCSSSVSLFLCYSVYDCIDSHPSGHWTKTGKLFLHSIMLLGATAASIHKNHTEQLGHALLWIRGNDSTVLANKWKVVSPLCPNLVLVFVLTFSIFWH